MGVSHTSPRVLRKGVKKYLNFGTQKLRRKKPYSASNCMVFALRFRLYGIALRSPLFFTSDAYTQVLYSIINSAIAINVILYRLHFVSSHL